ncbi:MAG: cyclic nucleotide-binding domain-containing protein, partial [Deferrisomatales bacterium]
MGWFFRSAKKDDKAAGDDHYAKGQWREALDAYERLLGRDPENVKLLRRVAELRARVGRRDEAAEAYRLAVELYARSGFLLQAIALQKILLRLDPKARDVGEKLADLYARRGFQTPSPGGGERRPVPEIPLFSDLDPESFRQVVDRLVPRTLAINEVLFRQGDPGDSIFVVTGGMVRVVRGELVLGELGEGTFFGEGAFFSREARSADVVATAPTELLEIRREDLEPLMSRHPGVANALGTFYRRRVLDGVLATSAVFGSLPEPERKRLADRFRLVPVGEGEVVVREGDRDRVLFLVKRGCFAVSTVPPGGREPVRLAELGAGAFFGEV